MSDRTAHRTGLANEPLERAAKVNVEFLKQTSRRDLCDWLLRAFETQEFRPAHIFPEPAPRRQLQIANDRSTPNVRSKFKSALVQAINECRPRAEGLSVFRELCFLASNIGASDAAPILRRRLVLREIRGDNAEERDMTISKAIGVIAAFAPSRQTKELFSDLLFDDTFDPRFAAQLLTGLCICSPGSYPRYLRRFLEIASKAPALFHLTSVIREVHRVVGVDTIRKHLHELDDEDRSVVVSRLSPTERVEIVKEYPRGRKRGWSGRDAPVLNTVVAVTQWEMEKVGASQWLEKLVKNRRAA